MTERRCDYEYQAEFVNAVDGNTVELELDLGFDMRMQLRFRLDKVNSWGLMAPLGLKRNKALAARAFVDEQLTEAEQISVCSCRRENDVYFADVFYKKPGGKKWHDLSKALLKQDLAILKTKRKKV